MTCMEVAIHITAARRTVSSSMESPVSYTNGVSHPLDKCSKFPVRSIGTYPLGFLLVNMG